MENENVVIIGAGPAGISTAIQLRRYGIKPAIFEEKEIGGLLRNANLVENYPGFKNGISGPDLVALIRSHLAKAGIAVIPDKVNAIALNDQRLILTTEKKKIHAKVVVVASGTKPVEFSGFDIPPEIEDRIYYEIASISGVEGKQIAIIGAGDAAFDYALNLCRNNKVMILNRKSGADCLPILCERAGLLNAISYHENMAISAISQTPSGMISIDCIQNPEKARFIVDYLVVAMGREPNLDFLSQSIIDNIDGLRQGGMLYFIGDVNNGIFRQATIAIGDGIKCAMQIYQRKTELDI
jgi:thioredoxin reductase